jgi:3-phosphoshikimate 1-carboxyvinyltransferase
MTHQPTRSRDRHRVALRSAPFDATVSVPGSKSVANRALVIAALAEGVSELSNAPSGDDTEAMLDCLEAIGVGVGRSTTTDSVTIVGGISQFRSAPVDDPIHLQARLAGTTSRFITALAALGPGAYVVDGLAPLRARPMGPLHDALHAAGASLTPLDGRGHLPVQLGRATWSTGEVAVPGDISSQFVSALMMIGPLLPGGLLLRLTSALISRPYVAITTSVMADFGVAGVEVTDDAIVVPPGRYRARQYEIEPDASSASYPLAAAAIVGGSVTINGLTATSLQGDAKFADVLQQMGCAVIRDELGTTVTAPHDGVLHGVSLDMSDLSDLVPTLAAVALFADSPTAITGVGFIRHKESDRLGDLARELQRLGADARDTDDGLVIRPVPMASGDRGAGLHGATLQTHDDHRLAMAFGLVGLRVADVEIADPDVTSKSWPGFWNEMATW